MLPPSLPSKFRYFTLFFLDLRLSLHSFTSVVQLWFLCFLSSFSSMRVIPSSLSLSLLILLASLRFTFFIVLCDFSLVSCRVMFIRMCILVRSLLHGGLWVCSRFFLALSHFDLGFSDFEYISFLLNSNYSTIWSLLLRLWFLFIPICIAFSSGCKCINIEESENICPISNSLDPNPIFLWGHTSRFLVKSSKMFVCQHAAIHTCGGLLLR